MLGSVEETRVDNQERDNLEGVPSSTTLHGHGSSITFSKNQNTGVTWVRDISAGTQPWSDVALSGDGTSGAAVTDGAV